MSDSLAKKEKEVEFSPLLSMMKQRQSEEAELFSMLLSCALKANKELDGLLQPDASGKVNLTPREIAQISKASVGSLSLIASYAVAREQLMERHSVGEKVIRARVGVEQSDGSKVVAEVEVGS